MDIHYGFNTLARFAMAPRQSHLTTMIRVFGYLKKNPGFQITADSSASSRIAVPTNPIEHTWTEFYREAQEEIPPDMPMPLGATPTTYMMLITRMTKSQGERSPVSLPWPTACRSDGTTNVRNCWEFELIAARIVTKQVIDIRYKLRMLGVPVTSPIVLLGDNRDVVLNSSVPSSMLKKKHHAIETIATRILRFIHIPIAENLADIMTKHLGPTVFHRILHSVMSTPTFAATDQTPTLNMVHTPVEFNPDNPSAPHPGPVALPPPVLPLSA
jgi:hypothetical protein